MMQIRNACQSAVLVLALFLGASALSGCASAQKTNQPTTLRVMTYNIHHGAGLDGKVDLLRIAQLIKENGADIVALQEVDRNLPRTSRRDFPEELAALTGMTAVFSNNYAFDGGEYGNAVLTKFPVKRWTNLHFKMLRPAEQRGILQLVLDVGGREVVFMNTHIDYRPDDAERWENVGEIEELKKKYGNRPIIMCGDFNAMPDSRVCQRIAESFDDAWVHAGKGDGFTIPVENPQRRIDYIWISKGKALTPKKISVLQSDASDHLPVIAELELK
jgi:endonuclease/exonuclease/phosphatase family metal-dependent hydrolase